MQQAPTRPPEAGAANYQLEQDPDDSAPVQKAAHPVRRASAAQMQAVRRGQR